MHGNTAQCVLLGGVVVLFIHAEATRAHVDVASRAVGM